MTAGSDISAPGDPRRGWVFGLLRVLVCGAAALVGGFFGLAASGTYSGFGGAARHTAGILLGGCGGVLAGVVWCRVMVPRARRTWRTGGGGKLVIGGLIWGIYVGLGCTVLLHAGLMIVAWRFEPALLALCLPFGAVAGLLTGLLCGVLTLIAAAVTRPSS